MAKKTIMVVDDEEADLDLVETIFKNNCLQTKTKKKIISSISDSFTNS